MRNIHIIIASVALMFVAHEYIAQTDTQTKSHIDEAIGLAEEGSFDRAILMIEPLLMNEAKSDGRAWYVAGYSHKERFKTYTLYSSSTSDRAELERSEAVRQLSESFELSTIESFSSGEITSPLQEISALSKDALSYLSMSYYNDAVKGVHSFQFGQDKKVMGYFKQYTAIRDLVDPENKGIREEVELEKNLARANRILLENEILKSSTNIEIQEQLFEKVVSHYERAITLDESDYTAKYNLAINLYNRGVSQLKAIDHRTSMFELMAIQDVCVELFERSLQPMKAAYEMKPGRLETLKGLTTIYRALSLDEQSLKYSRELDRALKLKKSY